MTDQPRADAMLCGIHAEYNPTCHMCTADQPRADAIAALRDAIESLDDDADTNRIWRAMSADRLAEVVGQRYFCGAPAIGGACVLPSGHNTGNADVPANHRAALAPADPTPFDEADNMCPNCVTPWKCNGPHLSDQTVASKRHAPADPTADPYTRGWNDAMDHAARTVDSLVASSPADPTADLRAALHTFLDDEGNHVGGVWGDYGEIVVSVSMVRDVLEGRVTPPATDEEWAYTNRARAALAASTTEDDHD